jgi:hypothetical protein
MPQLDQSNHDRDVKHGLEIEEPRAPLRSNGHARDEVTIDPHIESPDRDARYPRYGARIYSGSGVADSHEQS